VVVLTCRRHRTRGALGQQRGPDGPDVLRAAVVPSLAVVLAQSGDAGPHPCCRVHRVHVGQVGLLSFCSRLPQGRWWPKIFSRTVVCLPCFGVTISVPPWHVGYSCGGGRRTPHIDTLPSTVLDACCCSSMFRQGVVYGPGENSARRCRCGPR
jgi:hypothetical protein